MVYFKTFDEFFAASKELYGRNPAKTRFSFKFRQRDQKLVLKVTDDRVCLKYRTDQQADVKKLDKISTWFFAQTTDRTLGDDERKGD